MNQIFLILFSSSVFILFFSLSLFSVVLPAIDSESNLIVLAIPNPLKNNQSLPTDASEISSSNSEDFLTISNHAPVANAASDRQTVNESTSVTLVGLGSDPDIGDTLAYSWRQISGPPVTLENASNPITTFNAPFVFSDEVLRFSLTATDDHNASSKFATVSITVKNINSPPIADAGLDQTAKEGYVVTLDGSNSSDPDGDPLKYMWNQTTGSILVTLNDPSSALATFTSPAMNLETNITLGFSLTVMDDKNLSSTPENVTVTMISKSLSPKIIEELGQEISTTQLTENISEDSHITNGTKSEEKQYQFVKKWGTSGDGDGEFLFLEGIVVDSSDNVYVTDFDNHRVQKFDSEGNFITKWGTFGPGDGQFDYPKGIAIDSANNVYVADHDHVQKFSPLQ